MGKKCFVIMPFSKTTEKHNEKYWTTFFEIIKDLMEGVGYECTRSETGPYNLFKNILKNINSSDIVIAVLTDYNANVWYELGIRHTIKIGTLMLLQEDQKPPFDVSGFGIIFYEDSLGLNLNIKKAIKSYLEKCKEDICDSPVIDLLGHMGNKFKQKRILWVDDHPINNESIITFLGKKNVFCDIAVSTEMGINYYKRNKYDIIITDMGRYVRRYEEKDAGLTLIKELNSLDCKIPIIVYTTQNSINKYGQQALELGVYSLHNRTAQIIDTLSEILKF